MTSELNCPTTSTSSKVRGHSNTIFTLTEVWLAILTHYINEASITPTVNYDNFSGVYNIYIEFEYGSGPIEV